MTLVMPTRILVLGAGGREHALAWKLGNEPGVNRVVVAPGSDGIAEEPRVAVRAIDPLDPGAVVALARAEAVELAVVGPEAPLAAGVADALVAAGVPTVGPGADAARIETSKQFCHEVAAAAGVPMATARVVRSRAEAQEAVDAFRRQGHGFVVKEDGLAAGKGVTVFDADGDDADEHLAALYDRDATATLVIEERLEGREASLIALCDGRHAVALPIARDHKRLLDGDEGPNTGGMGAYSPVPDLPDAIADDLLDRFHRPILRELARRGTPFRGFLYAGLMLTGAGPRLLECNARLGDPETQAILPRVAGSIGPLLLAAARGSLPPDGRIAVLPGSTVAVVLAADRYPGAKSVGEPIDGIDRARDAGALVFHAGTRRTAGRWETDGGRVVTVVGRGTDVAAAREVADRAAGAISWRGVRRRRDIGSAATVAEAIA